MSGTEPDSYPSTPTSPVRLRQLLSLSASELATCDIALLNLLCAEGLSGSEGLSLQTCLVTLDRWAEYVHFETERHFYRFNREPAEYESSEPFFRMLVMVTVLQRTLGVRYNNNRIGDMSTDFFRDSRDLFIHGLLSGDRTGTCASIPVLYCAIGRRLGYPLNLALSKRHVYVRWESADCTLNLEVSGQGLACPPDDHFASGHFTLTPTEAASGVFLRSLKPAEAIAEFLMNRGCCLQRTRGLAAAMSSFRAAARLWDRHRGLVDSMEAIIAGADLTPVRAIRHVSQVPRDVCQLPGNILTSCGRPLPIVVGDLSLFRFSVR